MSEFPLPGATALEPAATPRESAAPTVDAPLPSAPPSSASVSASSDARAARAPAPTAFEIIQRETCFSGFYKLDRLQVRHQLFAGGMGPLLSRELFVRHDAVCVLPYDPQRDEVVLIEQFRIGAIDKCANPWLLELVAGLIDTDEQPEQVAHREAQEEAGLTFSALWPITGYYPSPGGSDEFVHLFVGRCLSAGAGGIHGLAEEGEDIRVHVWALEDALQAVRDGRINNAASIIALQWLALNRSEVRGMWR